MPEYFERVLNNLNHSDFLFLSVLYEAEADALYKSVDSVFIREKTGLTKALYSKTLERLMVTNLITKEGGRTNSIYISQDGINAVRKSILKKGETL
jgi:hypothetical protein